MTNVSITAAFSTGATVAINIWEVATETQVVTSGAMDEIGVSGVFKYTFDADPAKQYVAVASDGIGGTRSENLSLADLANIRLKTDNLPSDPADESLVEAAITSAANNIRGADSDTLKILSDQLDAVQADLDNPAQYKADVSALALQATSLLIKAKTDLLPADPSSETNATANKVAIIAEINANEVKIDAIAAKTNNLPANTESLLLRIAGLVQENFYIDNATHNASNRLTAGRMRTYSVAGSVGTDNNVLATYVITATYDGNGNLQTYSVVKQ